MNSSKSHPDSKKMAKISFNFSQQISNSSEEMLNLFETGRMACELSVAPDVTLWDISLNCASTSASDSSADSDEEDESNPEELDCLPRSDVADIWAATDDLAIEERSSHRRYQDNGPSQYRLRIKYRSK